MIAESIFFWSRLRQYSGFYIRSFPILAAAINLVSGRLSCHSCVVLSVC